MQTAEARLRRQENIHRFATRRRKDFLRSQFVTSNRRGGPRYLPYAFTEYGALMAANILNSARAVQMSILLFGPSRRCARRCAVRPSSRGNLLPLRKG